MSKKVQVSSRIHHRVTRDHWKQKRPQKGNNRDQQAKRKRDDPSLLPFVFSWQGRLSASRPSDCSDWKLRKVRVLYLQVFRKNKSAYQRPGRATSRTTWTPHCCRKWRVVSQRHSWRYFDKKHFLLLFCVLCPFAPECLVQLQAQNLDKSIPWQLFTEIHCWRKRFLQTRRVRRL